jgi:hypothetical protein
MDKGVNMTKDEFYEEIKPIAEAFPALKNRFKLQRIYDLAHDIPLDTFAFIVMKIGDDAKTSPSINDFKEHISKWKREYYAKTGRYWGQTEQFEKESTFECLQCIDSGIVELFSIGGGFSHHMRCDCAQGSKHWALMPQWDRALRQAFKPQAPDLLNFKPTTLEYGELMKKAEIWANKLEKSIKHWHELGYRP